MFDGHTWDNQDHGSNAWWWDTECTAQELATEIDNLRYQVAQLEVFKKWHSL